MNKFKLSLNQAAIAGLAKVLVGCILLAVIGYSEVMFLQIMGRVFPDGILKVVAMLGAVTTGVSVLTLLIGKSYWFRPGGQMVAAWLFTAVEVLVLLLNVLLSFQLNGGHVDGYLAVWYMLCPSSPLVALVGWVLILHLDRAQQDRHEQLEMEEEIRRAERQHQVATHEAKMQLRTAFLQSHTTYLQQEVNSPEIQRQLAIGASALAAHELSALTGMHIAPRLSSPEPLGLPAAGSLPHVQVKEEAAVGDDKQVERLLLLAEAAEAQGYSLDQLERMLGVTSSSNGHSGAKKLMEEGTHDDRLPAPASDAPGAQGVVFRRLSPGS